MFALQNGQHSPAKHPVGVGGHNTSRLDEDTWLLHVPESDRLERVHYGRAVTVNLGRVHLRALDPHRLTVAWLLEDVSHQVVVRIGQGLRWHALPVVKHDQADVAQRRDHLGDGLAVAPSLPEGCRSDRFQKCKRQLLGRADVAPQKRWDQKVDEKVG